MASCRSAAPRQPEHRQEGQQLSVSTYMPLTKNDSYKSETVSTCLAHSVGRTLFKDGVRLDGLGPLSPPPSVLSPPLIPLSSLLLWSRADLLLQPGEQSHMMTAIMKHHIQHSSFNRRLMVTHSSLLFLTAWTFGSKVFFGKKRNNTV